MLQMTLWKLCLQHCLGQGLLGNWLGHRGQVDRREELEKQEQVNSERKKAGQNEHEMDKMYNIKKLGKKIQIIRENTVLKTGQTTIKIFLKAISQKNVQRPNFFLNQTLIHLG